MIFTHQKITIIRSNKPNTSNINEDLQWLGQSLGLFNMRDKDRSCFRIFIELLKSAKKQHSISSDELAYKLNLSRGTVIHHINKLIDAGIVIPMRNKYILRVDTLKGLIEELKRDLEKTLNELSDIAEKIDKTIKS